MKRLPVGEPGAKRRRYGKKVGVPISSSETRFVSLSLVNALGCNLARATYETMLEPSAHSDLKT